MPGAARAHAQHGYRGGLCRQPLLQYPNWPESLARPGAVLATGLLRNDTIANNLNANVTNPFNIQNFAGLRTSDPLIYQDMTTQGFFTSSTIRKSQLLRPFPQMNGL